MQQLTGFGRLNRVRLRACFSDAVRSLDATDAPDWRCRRDVVEILREAKSSLIPRASCDADDLGRREGGDPKSEDRQARPILLCAREEFVDHGTRTVNALRAHLSAFGQVAPQGIEQLRRLRAVVEDGATDLLALPSA